jgi:pSer/pThr/pTyr-binding forkhead associated (FHA) protein
VRLVYERGGEQISFPIDDGETYIGRKDYCDIHLPEPSLSKRHVRLLREGNRLLLYDAGSRNGTMVNGELAEDGCELRNGDVIQAGKLEFRVEGIGGGSQGFDVMEESDPLAGGSIPMAQAVASRGAGSNLRTFPELPISRSGRQLAKAVHSQSARGSVLDVLPELQSVDGAPTITARFHLVEGGPEQTWDLIDGTLTVGSKPENDIVIRGDGVSRYHAEVVQEAGAWLIKDLGSRNGLFVGGDPADIHELQDGDEVVIGTIKLRFELVKPPAIAPLTELLDKFKQGGVVTVLKEDRRARMGLSVAIFAILMLWMAGSGPGGGRAVAGGGEWLTEGTTLLAAGKYKAAQSRFQQAISRGEVSSTMQHVPRTLAKTAGLWTKSGDPMRFRWAKAEGQLAEVVGLGELPSALLGWVSDQEKWVKRNGQVYDLLTAAETVAARADEQASLGRFEGAYKTYYDGLSKFKDVPTDSMFDERAKQRLSTVQVQVYSLVLAEVQRLMRVTSPQWDDVLGLIRRGEEFADTVEKRKELRALKDECRTNRRDEQNYMRAVDIVQVRDVANYPKALRLLDGISPRSRIYPDARAYMDWIDADLKVREAKRAYDQGDEQRAFLLLNEALRHEVLGPEARASVRTRRQKWAKVARHFAVGMQLSRSGQLTECKREFEAVLQSEPNRENRFHSLARKQLNHIAQGEMMTLDRKLRGGIQELNDGDYVAAARWFNLVKQDRNVQRRDLEQIRYAVDDVVRRKRLVRGIERDVMNDRTEKFLDDYYVLKLLREWLPKNHTQMPKIDRYFKQIQSRLRTILRNHPEFQGPPRRPGRPR